MSTDLVSLIDIFYIRVCYFDNQMGFLTVYHLSFIIHNTQLSFIAYSKSFLLLQLKMPDRWGKSQAGQWATKGAAWC